MIVCLSLVLCGAIPVNHNNAEIDNVEVNEQYAKVTEIYPVSGSSQEIHTNKSLEHTEIHSHSEDQQNSTKEQHNEELFTSTNDNHGDKMHNSTKQNANMKHRKASEDNTKEIHHDTNHKKMHSPEKNQHESQLTQR